MGTSSASRRRRRAERKPSERKSNSLVRHSHLVVSTPSLLIGYHIEKTAGSALMKWLHKQVNEPARLTCLFDYMCTNCFFALHPDLFPAWADAWTFERCGTDIAPNWTRAALALEFHGYSKYRYWSILGKQLPALRRKYASLGGPLITTTTIREPSAHIQSSYFMWPPYIGPKVTAKSCRDTRRPRPPGIACPVAVPLPSWLPFAAGLQVGSLTLSSSHTPKARGWHNPLGCSKLALARERLASFDVVGSLHSNSPRPERTRAPAALLALCPRTACPVTQPLLGPVNSGGRARVHLGAAASAFLSDGLGARRAEARPRDLAGASTAAARYRAGGRSVAQPAGLALHAAQRVDAGGAATRRSLR